MSHLIIEIVIVWLAGATMKNWVKSGLTLTGMK